MSAALQNPDLMSLEAFLAWDAPPNVQCQLVDGVPVAMAPASPVHGAIQNELGALLRNHLASQGGQCRAYANPGVKLGEKTDTNFRIPDLGVSCAPVVAGEPTLPDPVLLVEILSPSNPRETWMNVWACTSIPSVQEVLVVRGDIIGAQVLRRLPDGNWPVVPDSADDGLDLRSIDLRLPLKDLYVGTWLAANAT